MSRSNAARIIIMLLLFANLSLMLIIQPAKAAGTVYIKPDGSVDPPGTLIQKNGDTYTLTGDISASIVVQKSNIIIDGAGHLLQGSPFETGIDLSSLTEVTVKNVTVSNFDNGVYVFSSNNISISGNTIINNNVGIWLKESTENLVSGNLIKDNLFDGIYIWSSSNNTISQNNVESNVYGITDILGLSNKIYHNNIVNNQYSVNPNEPADIWDDDYPLGGNYWSDYNGTDSYSGPYQNVTGSDGIGDTPYVIDAQNQDNYPLMNQYVCDVAVINVTTCKDGCKPFPTAPENYFVQINVTVQNLGSNTEDFKVTVYADSTLINQTQLSLPSATTVTFTFKWNATLPYGNYTTNAVADTLPGESNTMNNTFVGSTVLVTIPGDINGDQYVNAKDAVRLGTAFGSTLPSPSWNANADINNDGYANAKDAVILGTYFGQHWS